MYEKAKTALHSKFRTASNWQTFMTELNSRNIVLVPWCGN